jgi:hypothetical protein
MEYELIICVYGCVTIDKYKAQLLKMDEKIGSLIENDLKDKCKIIYFLEKNDILNDDQKFIVLDNVNNDYMSATYKQWYGLNYIYNNYKTNFVMCIGTDTYVNVKKCLNLLRNYNYNDNLLRTELISDEFLKYLLSNLI